jgi:hypothetical protein
MTNDHTELIAEEEAKRAAHCAPELRWKLIQNMIRWAEGQRTAPPQTKEARLAEQARKLALPPPQS